MQQKIPGLPDGFCPTHPEWDVPSKRNRYNMWLAQQKEASGEVKPVDLNGTLCFTTMVSGNHQWYIPLFVHTIKKQFPQADIKIFVRGEIEKKLCDDYQGIIVPLDIAPEYPDGFVTAALRFVIGDDILSAYDYVLITDIDMLHREEAPSLVYLRATDMRISGLECYSNHIHGSFGGSPCMPGVHFVTKEWWPRTKEIREHYLKMLCENGSAGKGFDEAILYKICAESNLPLPGKLPKLWHMHGVHMGDYRDRVLRKEKTFPGIGAPNQMLMSSLLSDINFIALMERSSKYIDTLWQTFEKYRENIR